MSICYNCGGNRDYSTCPIRSQDKITKMVDFQRERGCFRITEDTPGKLAVFVVMKLLLVGIANKVHYLLKLFMVNWNI
jgi:hypothetical protein